MSAISQRVMPFAATPKRELMFCICGWMYCTAEPKSMFANLIKHIAECGRINAR